VVKADGPLCNGRSRFMLEERRRPANGCASVAENARRMGDRKVSHTVKLAQGAENGLIVPWICDRRLQ
jgi:hypothetical protein